ncbi:hypothetical protein ZIOFF_033780 [Zingiber officinale]|uniref:Uncharacterized protein n=1 Tax=Zingiber officinale TaxID=94328 RepID=A0A8J5GIP9_ZINOF|nr:hypothetical protein ZIOFF_033780 [Zingiber officinale]
MAVENGGTSTPMGKVKSLIEDAKGSPPLNVPGSSCNPTSVGNNSPPSMFPAGSVPPLSPRSKCGSPHFLKRNSNFYFHNGRPPPKALKEQCLSRIDHLFFGNMDGLQLQEFKTVTKEICKLPSFLSTSFFRKCDAECTGMLSSCMSVLHSFTLLHKVVEVCWLVGVGLFLASPHCRSSHAATRVDPGLTWRRHLLHRDREVLLKSDDGSGDDVDGLIVDLACVLTVTLPLPQAADLHHSKRSEPKVAHVSFSCQLCTSLAAVASYRLVLLSPP